MDARNRVERKRFANIFLTNLRTKHQISSMFKFIISLKTLLTVAMTLNQCTAFNEPHMNMQHNYYTSYIDMHADRCKDRNAG